MFSFDFFLRVSISLLILPLCSCILSFSSIKAYRILIAVALNSHSYIIMSEFGYDAFSIFTNCGVFFFFFCLSVQFSSVAQSYPTLCNTMNCSMPGLPVHHPLPEFTHTHVHLVSDAIQPSHPLSSPSPPVPNPSQHQSFPVSQLFA